MSHWRLSDLTLGVLAVLGIMAVWEGIAVNNWPATHGCGGDFPQYYVAGTIVRRGETERLYDQPYFRHIQEPLREDPLHSIYPPTVGLIMAPLTRLSYHQALAVWWAMQAVCILAAGTIIYRTAPLPKPWRINVLAAVVAMVPLWIAVGIGQLAPFFLLVVAGGLTLHRRGKCGWAGLVLSILALKPQLTLGLVLWMLLRRDLRTLLGLAAGFALQAAAVALLLGPSVWLDYLHALPAISAVTRRAHYSPLMEASLVGIASNLLWSAGLSAWEAVAMKITYAVSVSAALVMLCRVVWARRRGAASKEQGAGSSERGAGSRTLGSWKSFGPAVEVGCGQAQRRPTNNHFATEGTEFTENSKCGQAQRRPTKNYPAHEIENYEYACGVLFMMIVPPYFILYDQTLLAIPLVMLWSTPAWRWGVALFATTTVLVINFSLVLGFSFSGLAALATMCFLARSATAAAQKTRHNPAIQPAGLVSLE